MDEGHTRFICDRCKYLMKPEGEEEEFKSSKGRRRKKRVNYSELSDHEEGSDSEEGDPQGMQDVSCVLCGRRGGAFKRCVDGRWCHMFCALMVDGVTFQDPSHLIGIDISGVDKAVCTRI